MPAVAGEFQSPFGIVAIIAAILFIILDLALAGRMSAFLGISHDGPRAFFVPRTAAAYFRCAAPHYRGYLSAQLFPRLAYPGGEGGGAVADTIASILQNKSGAIWSVAPHASVYDAIALMADKSIGALLVMSGPRLDGIISERDYARKVILQGRSSKDTPVEEIMTRSVITVTPDHTIDECMRIVTECRIRHLPVLSGESVVGVISIGDLVNAIISDQAHTITQLHTYICGSAIVK